MNCPNCGNKIEEGKNFCSSCGTEVNNQNNTTIKRKNDGKAIASLILGISSIIVPCIGFITALIGLILGVLSKEKGGIRTAGIIINTISLVFFIICMILVFVFGVFENGSISDVINDTRNKAEEVDNYFDKDKDTDSYDYSDDDYTINENDSEEQKAIKTAKSYLDYLPFSRSELINQLEFEDFTEEMAIYGADHCGANWNEQASKKAKNYLKFSTYTHEELVEVLESDGFTHNQAEYGATKAGV